MSCIQRNILNHLLIGACLVIPIHSAAKHAATPDRQAALLTILLQSDNNISQHEQTLLYSLVRQNVDMLLSKDISSSPDASTQDHSDEPPAETESPTASPSFQYRSEPTQYTWPVRGDITVNYGDPILGSKFKVDHLVITTQDTDIKSTEAGIVLYAKWMPELGLTVIVDHGDDYHSIYANCDRLHTNEGDRVKAHQTIAQFIGQDNIHTLYFAMRHKGHAIHPKTMINVS